MHTIFHVTIGHNNIYYFESFRTPLIVRKGDPLEASVSAPRDESLRKCYVYNTNLDDFYITLNSEMKEIQSFIIEQDDTKLDLSSITEKPGRYFLKLRRSYRTEINRVVTVVEGTHLICQDHQALC